MQLMNLSVIVETGCEPVSEREADALVRFATTFKWRWSREGITQSWAGKRVGPAAIVAKISCDAGEYFMPGQLVRAEKLLQRIIAEEAGNITRSLMAAQCYKIKTMAVV